MSCNKLRLVGGAILVLAITLMIASAVFISPFFILLLAGWLIGLYVKIAFVCRVDRDSILVFRYFRLYTLRSSDVTRVYARHSDEGYRGFIFDYRLPGETESAGLPFGFDERTTDLLNLIRGRYPIDKRSFEQLGIVDDGRTFSKR